jgi:hypothetical protein
LARGIIGDFLVGQECDQALLEGAQAAFNSALALWTGSDPVSESQRGQGTLEFEARVAPVSGGLATKEGERVVVEGHGEPVEGEATAEVLELAPSDVGGYESGPEQLAGVVVDGEQESLLVVSGPPLMD